MSPMTRCISKLRGAFEATRALGRTFCRRSDMRRGNKADSEAGSETTPQKRSRYPSPTPTRDAASAVPGPSPRRQRLEVREQEKASIVNCVAIQASRSGFRDLSLCDKAQFTECQYGKQGGNLPVLPTTPPQMDVEDLRVSARKSSLLIPQSTMAPNHIPPDTNGIGVTRRLSNEISSSGSLSGDHKAGSLGSGACHKEIKGYNAIAMPPKNPMRPPSSRGGHSSSLSMRRPISRAAKFLDLATREAMAKNNADLKHSRDKLDAYTKHTAALERVCREAGLSVPTLTLPRPPLLHVSSLSSSSPHHSHRPQSSSDSSPHALTRAGFALSRGPSLGSTLGSTISAIREAPQYSPSANLYTIRPPSASSSGDFIQPPSAASHTENLMAACHAPVHGKHATVDMNDA